MDPEDADEWCINPPSHCSPHPTITNLHLKFNAKHASVSSTETVSRVCVLKHYRSSLYVFMELSCYPSHCQMSLNVPLKCNFGTSRIKSLLRRAAAITASILQGVIFYRFWDPIARMLYHKATRASLRSPTDHWTVVTDPLHGMK